MKQKNMLLVAVAVVCGLIAAFLTSQMSARSKKQQVEMVNVPQAAVDLPIGTKIKAEDFDKMVKMVPVPREQAPVAFVEDVNTLKDKRVTRTMRANDTFNPADVTTNEALNPPEGFSVMTARVSMDEAVAGFVRPGAKVDVIASVQMKKSQKRIIFPLFTDILILAIDSSAQGPKEGGQTFANLSMISFAVDKDTSLLLQAAITCGAQMRCALRHPEKPVKYDAMTSEEMWDILSGKIEDDVKQDKGTKEPEAPKVELVKVKVPTIDLTAGTEITDEFVTKNFTEVEYPKTSVPENTARDFDAAIRKGQYLLKDVAANHFVPKSFLGPKAEKAAEPVKPTEEPKAVPAKKEYVEVTVNTIRGLVRHRYEVLKNGDYKYAGVVGDSTDDEDSKKQPETKDGEKSPVQ